ncbi:hypothetical protein PGT21_005456, partial [Puccinia graminis f. sp. tritici]
MIYISRRCSSIEPAIMAIFRLSRKAIPVSTLLDVNARGMPFPANADVDAWLMPFQWA